MGARISNVKILGDIFDSLRSLSWTAELTTTHLPIVDLSHQTTLTDMSVPTYLSRPALRCLRNKSKRDPSWAPLYNGRSFVTTAFSQADASLESKATRPTLDPSLVSTRRDEQTLIKTGIMPIGSRRRRAALQNSKNIPFEQLPYQCFQEARKILQSDREETLKQIEVQRRRIEKAKAAYNASPDHSRKGRLIAMQKYLEELKILADINDPMIKKRFEDGEGMRELHRQHWAWKDIADYSIFY